MEEGGTAQGVFQRSSMRTSTLELLWWWFHRIVAVYCLAFGVVYWVRLVGVYDGPAWRFDLMPVHWQVASVSLAALFPFAASGLWMVASWGPVIWFLCAAIETAMYLGLPDYFGSRPLVIATHAMVAAIYCAFRVVFFLRRRSERD